MPWSNMKSGRRSEALPPYRPVRVIGDGGSARVVLSEDIETGEQVAVKVMRNGPDAHAMVLARFEREIAVQRQLDHPQIARVLDDGVLPDGSRWYAMPYFPRGSLYDLLMLEGRVEVTRLAGFACEVLDALSHAHEQGIVHRDVKPANILLDSDDVAVLCDFGIARQRDEPFTRAGSQLGTPVYAAPEQLQDPRAASPCADLYALGVALYAAATMDSPARLIYPHTRPQALKQIPAELRGIIRRATEPEVHDRYASAVEMARNLCPLV